MGRMATRTLARGMIAGVAAFAGMTCMAQGPGRADAPRSAPVQIAQMPQAAVGPAFRAGRPIQLTPTTDGPTQDAPLSFGRSRPADRAEPPGPAAGALATGAVPAGAASGRVDEAQALTRLRARLEETLARHAAVDASVSVDRNALRVVSHGVDSPVGQAPAATGANTRVRRKPATVAAPRATRRSTESKAGAHDWSYSGDTGPAHWATLDPEWAACGAEVPQSPIDIRDGVAVGLPPIQFDLPPAILTIRDDGRAIRAVVREGPAIGMLGRRFELREISFHQPAEFRVDGKAFDLSAQLLHRDEQGRVAVVVVLFEIGDDASPRNPVVQAVLDYLPLARDMLMPVADRIELDSLLPVDRGYYNFVGALSSPPCTEGAIWMVMREPLRLPPSQVAIFARVHPMNVRPLQPLAGRLIKQSE